MSGFNEFPVGVISEPGADIFLYSKMLSFALAKSDRR